MADEQYKQDLFNFTNKAFQTSKYILTSPRSLRACAKLKIKPSELLPKNLEDFCNDPATGHLSKEQLKQMFQHYEITRLEKLKQAQEEWKRLAKKELRNKSSSHHKLSGCCTAVAKRKTSLPSAQSVSQFELLKEDSKLLQALSAKLEDERETELLQLRARQCWVEEKERKEREKEQAYKAHQKYLAAKQQRDRDQMNRAQSLLKFHERERTKEKKVASKAAWEKWTVGKDRQDRLKEEHMIAKKKKEKEKKISQEEQKAVLSFTEELERRRLEEQIAKTTDQVESNKMLLERQQQIRRQVKNTTDRMLFEMRFKERVKEEESGQELLNLAVQLKDKETQRRLTQQMALRFEQLRQKRTRERKLTERVQENVKLSREVSEKWQEEIMKEHQKCMEKADLLAKRNMEEKRLRVKELQVDHLVERMQNYQQVKDSEEAKLRQLKEKVQEEDMKYKRYKNAKEREMQDTRRRAEVAARLREQIKEKRNKGSLHQYSNHIFLEDRVKMAGPTDRQARTSKTFLV